MNVFMGSGGRSKVKFSSGAVEAKRGKAATVEDHLNLSPCARRTLNAILRTSDLLIRNPIFQSDVESGQYKTCGESMNTSSIQMSKLAYS